MGDDWPDLPLLRRAALRLRAGRTRMPRCAPSRTTSPQAARRPRRGARVLRPAADRRRPLRRAAATADADDARRSARAGELHRCDAPSPRRAGRRAGRRAPWPLRLRERVSAYLPLLLMALLALGHLVAGAEHAERRRRAAEAPLRHEPDYTMRGFIVQRFAPRRRACSAQIEGDELRHYPDTDTLEIDQPRIRAIGAGRRRDRRDARSARSPTATAARCSCSATRTSCASRRTASAGDRVPRRVPARVPATPSGCARTCRWSSRSGATRGRAPTAWTYDNLAPRRSTLQGPDAARPSLAGARPAGADEHDRAAGLHHRRVERHRPGAGARATTAPAGGSRWSRGATTSSRTGRAAQRLRRRALRGLRRRRARRRQHRRRRPRLHRARRACPTSSSPMPASASASTPAMRADLEVMRAHLRDQQPRPGGDVPSLHRADARARLGHAGRHRQRRRHPRPARARRLLRRARRP